MKRNEYPKRDLFGGVVHPIAKGKVCRICKVFKSYDFFYKCSASKDGCRSACKSCEKELHREIHSRKHPIAEEKVCACCGRMKDSPMFAKDPTQTDGLHSHCKSCMHEARLHNKAKKMIVKPKSRKRFVQ